MTHIDGRSSDLTGLDLVDEAVDRPGDQRVVRERDRPRRTRRNRHGRSRRGGHAGVVFRRTRVVDRRTNCDGGDQYHGRTGDGQRAAEGGTRSPVQAARGNGDLAGKGFHLAVELAVFNVLHASASRTFARARLSNGPTLTGAIPSASPISS